MKHSLLLCLSASIFATNSANASWSKTFASFTKRFIRHEYVSGLNYYQDRLERPGNNNLSNFNQNQPNYPWNSDLVQSYNQKNFNTYEWQQQFLLQQAVWNVMPQQLFYKQFFSKLNKNPSFFDKNIALQELGINPNEYSGKREEFSWTAPSTYKNIKSQMAQKSLDPKLFGIYESPETKDSEKKYSRENAGHSDCEQNDSNLLKNLKIFKIEEFIAPPITKNFKQNPWEFMNRSQKNDYIFLDENGIRIGDNPGNSVKMNAPTINVNSQNLEK